MTSTPASLLHRLRGTPEDAAWERFVELYTPLLFRWAARTGLDRHAAADLVQDVFAVLVEKLPAFEYDPAQSFRAWLKTVLVNRWRNLRREHVPAAGGSALADAPAPEPADLGEDEYRRWLAGRAVRLLEADFAPETWKAFWGTAVEGRRAGEVAAEFGLSVNAVYLARSRVLRRLREELAGLLD